MSDNNTTSNSASQPAFNNPLLNIYFLNPQQKADKNEGKKIAQAIYRQQTASETSLNFFRGRNARWIELLLWAKGSQNQKEFLDYMNVSDANKAYVQIDMTQQRIAPQFVGTLIESMAKNKFYPCVKATDDGSIDEKEQRKRDALFRMHDKDVIAEIQNASGVQIEPQTAYVPRDEMSANVFFELEDRLPKEIRFEKMLKKTLDDIKFNRVLNRAGLRDMIVLNFEATKIEKIAPKCYTVRKCIPTNMVYNFFISDTGDCELTQIGEFYNLKVKDLRKKFGKSPEKPDGLTEKEIFELAKLSTQKNIGVFNWQWNEQWSLLPFNMYRPYDDCSILVFDFEIDCGEDLYAVEKTDNYGKQDFQLKKNVPYQQVKKNGEVIEQPKPDNVNIIKRKKNTWMRGVYAPYGDKMLFWGTPDIIVSPYKDVYKTLSSYSVNIPNNDGEYVPSLFERIIEPLREYTLIKLKRKQLIAKLVPDGIRVDVESARNIDLGNGNTLAWEEVVRIYEQTGNEIWSSRGVNPNDREPPPFSNTVQRDTIQKIVQLTGTLQALVDEMRMLIGSSVYLEGGDLGERTAAKLAEGQVENASNVNGFALNAHIQLWEETCYKLTCLHWNDVVKEEPESENDLINTVFDVSIEMKSTEYERQMLDRDIQTWSQVIDGNGNPLVTPKDSFKLRNIDNYKLAELYLADTIEENKQRAEEQKQKDIEANAAQQQQSAALAAQAQQEQAAMAMEAEKEMKEFQSQKDKELKVLDIIAACASKGIDVPPYIMTIVQQLVPNITVPLANENKEMVQTVIQQEHDKMAHDYAQQQMPQQPQMQQGEPQQQMQQQQMQPQPQDAQMPQQ